MTKEQIKYLRDRLVGIRDKKMTFTRYPSTDLYDQWFEEGAFAVVKSGSGYSVKWLNIEGWQKNIADQQEKIRIAFNTAMDTLILGDAEEALAMIRKFEEEV